MRFIAIIAAIFVSKTYAEQSYGFGSTTGVNLPSTLGGSSSSSSSSSFSSSSGNVVVPSFPRADLSRVGLGSVNSVASTIISARNELSTPVVRNINSVFSRFPSSLQVAQMADAGDVAGITKLLSVVATDDSVSCDNKIAYLMDLLGQVREAVRRKTLVHDQLKAVIDGAKGEVTRLTDQLNKAVRDRDALGLPALDTRVTDLSGRITDLYARINAVKTQIGPEEARITGYERELQTLIRQNDDERNKITNDRLKLAQTDSHIKDLETRLQDARAQRTAIQTAITTSQNSIRDNQKKADTIRNTINDINSKIRGLQDNLDVLRRQSNTLEVDIQRSRTDSSVAQVQDNKLADDIRALQDRINALQPNTDDTDLKNLRAIVSSLNRVLPNINNDINREYYYCYGAGKVETLNVGSTVVYVVRGQAFGQYIQTAYGQTPSVVSGADYRLQVIDPFSPIWTSKFGFPSFAVAGGAGGAGGAGSSSCLSGGLVSGSSGSSGSLPTGLGVISGVTADGFQVRDSKGNLVSLSIGGCSRIQSTSSLPSTGQTIAWRGVPSSAGGYSLYAATCW